MKINLAQALRLQKRAKEMVGKISEVIRGNNSILVGGTRDVDIEKALTVRGKIKEYLINLKLILQEASRPIQRDILTISELKDSLGFYRGLDVTHGKKLASSYGSQVGEAYHDAAIRLGNVEKTCLKIQHHLDGLYSKIDSFNATTFVEVEELPIEEFVSTVEGMTGDVQTGSFVELFLAANGY